MYDHMKSINLVTTIVLSMRLRWRMDYLLISDIAYWYIYQYSIWSRSSHIMKRSVSSGCTESQLIEQVGQFRYFSWISDDVYTAQTGRQQCSKCTPNWCQPRDRKEERIYLSHSVCVLVDTYLIRKSATALSRYQSGAWRLCLNTIPM